jgi:hydroxymethylglutaryl-CoA lyase
MFSRLPERVSIYEVSPRDGLQNESSAVPLESKKQLIGALVAAGLKRVEVTSFVSARWVPQLADADALVRELPAVDGVTYSALCPNAKGFERAKAARLKEIAVFLSATETHNQRNTNRSIARSMDVFEELVPVARDAGMRVRAYISMVWGCPYEGKVDPQRALEIGRELVRWGVYEVSLGDTIGVGTPLQTQQICELFLNELGPDHVALHLHDTRGTALANALVGVDVGIRTFDASIAGLGGCPYAPGASGNLATEDLVYMLHGMGIDTGVDLEALVHAGRLATNLFGRGLPGKVSQSGLPSVRAPRSP